jgi:hypothetical protein
VSCLQFMKTIQCTKHQHSGLRALYRWVTNHRASGESPTADWYSLRYQRDERSPQIMQVTYLLSVLRPVQLMGIWLPPSPSPQLWKSLWLSGLRENTHTCLVGEGCSHWGSAQHFSIQRRSREQEGSQPAVLLSFDVTD